VYLWREEGLDYGPLGRASAVAKTVVAVATLIKWLLW
jgi:hypothetical protein